MLFDDFAYWLIIVLWSCWLRFACGKDQPALVRRWQPGVGQSLSGRGLVVVGWDTDSTSIMTFIITISYDGYVYHISNDKLIAI